MRGHTGDRGMTGQIDGIGDQGCGGIRVGRVPCQHRHRIGDAQGMRPPLPAGCGNATDAAALTADGRARRAAGNRPGVREADDR